MAEQPEQDVVEALEAQARAAMEKRFATRLATEEERNAYEVGYFEALSASKGKWMPIESAPKDEWVNAWDGENVTPMMWVDDSHEYGSGDLGWCFGSPHWGGILYEGIHLADPQPIAWQPLPNPPTSGEGE